MRPDPGVFHVEWPGLERLQQEMEPPQGCQRHVLSCHRDTPALCGALLRGVPAPCPLCWVSARPLGLVASSRRVPRAAISGLTPG